MERECINIRRMETRLVVIRSNRKNADRKPKFGKNVPWSIKNTRLENGRYLFTGASIMQKKTKTVPKIIDIFFMSLPLACEHMKIISKPYDSDARFHHLIIFMKLSKLAF